MVEAQGVGRRRIGTGFSGLSSVLELGAFGLGWRGFRLWVEGFGLRV